MRGVVQGVGYRPFVHRLATELGLAGFVGNDSTCVFIEVEGDAATLDRFVESLTVAAPRMAHVESVVTSPLPLAEESGFRIVDSTSAPGVRTFVPPDVAVCDECVAELSDPADRRYRYPFGNCTNCGPRFTIIRDLPYDRRSTTMDRFALCPECAAEYADPTDRRYHAQPIACPACGPSVALAAAADGDVAVGTDAVIAGWQRIVADGGVVAVKGVGGFHLTCDATSDIAVGLLRDRKGRADKPFAVMVADLPAAQRYAHIDDLEAEALQSAARPIVLLRRRVGTALSAALAPGNPLIGLLLPYTPLHHLLLHQVPGTAQPPPDAVVMTSGNLSNEPICTDDDEARARLATVADAFLTHDRPIHVPCDDSVVRVVDGVLQPVRRSRGYTPLPVTLPVDVAPTLAVGAELKNTFCLAAGRHAWISQHIGDMENLETLDAFEHSVDSFRRMYAIEPEVIATDGHPGYLTRRWALQRAGGMRVVDVQHHHAHVAAVMVEAGLDGSTPVLGFAFDGTGFGLGADREPQIWGGEVLEADYDGFERVAHLRPLPLPGGDGAVHNPCRVAVAYLAALGVAVDETLPCVAACDSTELRVVRRQVERNVGCVPTTSMGRLFDAVASILGVRHRVSYEAQAAIELEARAELAVVHEPRWSFALGAQGVIDPLPVLRGLVADMEQGVSIATLAYAFHRAVADAVVEIAVVRAASHPKLPVALTGGVFQNALLARLARASLQHEGFEVLTHRLVPPNDGGLSLGQAVIAGHGRT